MFRTKDEVKMGKPILAESTIKILQKADWVVTWGNERTKKIIDQIILALGLSENNKEDSRKTIYFNSKEIPTLNVNFDFAMFFAEQRESLNLDFYLFYKSGQAGRVLWSEGKKGIKQRSFIDKARGISVTYKPERK